MLTVHATLLPNGQVQLPPRLGQGETCTGAGDQPRTSHRFRR